MSPGVSVRLLQAQSDKRLFELVGRGYERAFEAVVLRHRPPLLAYCRRLGLSEQRAEDVVQQALLKAWLALREGAVVREARPWLFRITHNTALNAMRAQEDVDQVDTDALVAVGAESAFERRAAAREALSDVASLPPMQREVVLLSAVDGRSHAEVADALGISSGAVRGLLYRARAALRGAAAALTPQPLLAWAAGGGGAPTAGRLLEISASGGGDLGVGLFKGAALGITAMLAAGAVIVPRAVHESDAGRASTPAPGATSAQEPATGDLQAGSAATNLVPALHDRRPGRSDASARGHARSGSSRGRDGTGRRRGGLGGDDGRRDGGTGQPVSEQHGGSSDGGLRSGSSGGLDGGSSSSDGGTLSGGGGTSSGDSSGSAGTVTSGSSGGGSGTSDGGSGTSSGGSGTSGGGTGTSGSDGSSLQPSSTDGSG